MCFSMRGFSMILLLHRSLFGRIFLLFGLCCIILFVIIFTCCYIGSSRNAEQNKDGGKDDAEIFSVCHKKSFYNTSFLQRCPEIKVGNAGKKYQVIELLKSL